MKDFLYIYNDKFMFLSADEEISYRQAWELVNKEFTETNKSMARKETVKELYKCSYNEQKIKEKDKSFTDLENLITI